MPAQAARPTLEQQVEVESQAMAERFSPVARKYRLPVEAAMKLSIQLGARDWNELASRLGVPGKLHKQLWTDLNALPHPDFDQKTPYNLLTPGRDRWGVNVQEGLKGWSRWGPLIEEVALGHGLDPAILGAYVWTESNFDTRQHYASHGLHAVGLGSVQAQDYPQLGGTLEARVKRLQEDPRLNLELTAREFKTRWNPQDMFGTVMDVWYPAWRRRSHIPSVGNAFGYMQLFSNRYFLLLAILGQ